MKAACVGVVQWPVANRRPKGRGVNLVSDNSKAGLSRRRKAVTRGVYGRQAAEDNMKKRFFRCGLFCGAVAACVPVAERAVAAFLFPDTFISRRINFFAITFIYYNYMALNAPLRMLSLPAGRVLSFCQ